jgi:hypothetical protein
MQHFELRLATRPDLYEDTVVGSREFGGLLEQQPEHDDRLCRLREHGTKTLKKLADALIVIHVATFRLSSFGGLLHAPTVTAGHRTTPCLAPAHGTRSAPDAPISTTCDDLV